MAPRLFQRQTKIRDAQDAQDEIARHDRENRIREEKEILKIAREKGRFELWLAETLIAHGTATRIIAEQLPLLQSKDDCALAHAGKTGKIALIGEVYKIPFSVIIGGGYIVYLVRHFFPAAEPIVKMMTGQ